MFPSAGLGAVSAMQDAVTLANCLYELSEHPSTAEISKAFKNYQNERYPFAKNAYDTSHRLAGVVGTVRLILYSVAIIHDSTRTFA